jgi:hypothetical protein
MQDESGAALSPASLNIRMCPKQIYTVISQRAIVFSSLIQQKHGGVAQLAEQRTHKPRVTRSIRVTATIPTFG